MVESNKIHFVVGMSRAGTTWMSDCLNKRPDTVSFGETMFFGRNFCEPTGGEYTEAELDAISQRFRDMKIGPRDGGGSLKKETLEVWGEEFARRLGGLEAPTPSSVFSLMCEIVASHEGKEFVVEKTPHHLNWVERISDNFPLSRFVVMIREPVGFLRSYKNQGAQESDSVRDAFSRLYHPIQPAIVWRGYAESANAVESLAPGRVMLVRYENLVSDPEGTVEKVFAFLGLPSLDVPLDVAQRVNSSVSSGRVNELSKTDIFFMKLVAGRSAKAIGYDIGEQGFDWSGFCVSVFRLPVWAIRNLAVLRRHSNTNLVQYLVRWLR